MRRALLLCSVLVVALFAAPARADSVVMVDAMALLDDGSTCTSTAEPAPCFGVFGRLCANPAQETALPVRVRIHPGPGEPRAGTHSWFHDLAEGDAAGPFAFPSMPMSEITVANISFHATEQERGLAWAFYQEPADTGTESLWVGVATLELPAGTWTEFRLPEQAYSWTKYDRFWADWKVIEPLSPSGGPAFVDTDGEAGYGGYGATMGCNGTEFSYDKFSIGSAGNVTTYDFEEWATTTSMLSTGQTIVAGKAASIRGNLGPLLIGSAEVRLEAKAYDSSQWVLAGVGTAEGGDPFSVGIKPFKETSYRWVFPGTDRAAPSTSSSIVVKVKTALTAARSVSAVKVGRSFTVKGRSTPAKPGFTATLWRKTANGPVRLKTATIKPDRTYAFTVKPTRTGRWTMYVTVPAGAGNLAGTSSTTSVDVVR